MTWRRSGGILLCSAALFASACGSDTEDKLSDGWTTNEQTPEEVIDPILPTPDVGVDEGTQPDVFIDESCQVLGCPEGQVCGDDGLCTAASCTNDDQCGGGLACTALGDEGKTCQQPTGVADGEGCTQDSDCQGGTCITDWPGGYCTTPDCNNFEDCSRLGNDNRCLQVRGPDICVRLCTSDAECRDGYVCQGLSAQQGACFPAPPPPAQAIDPAVLANNPLNITCQDTVNGVATFDFTVSPGATSYMVTPIDPTGNQLVPSSISRPLGSAITFNGANRFQATPSQVFGNMNPTIIPATPDFVGQLEPGAHTYTVQSASEQMCWYKLEESQPGDSIDLNIHLVGLQGVNAANAAQNANLQATLNHVNALYQAAGISLGTIRYFDASPAIAQNFSIVRNADALGDLVASTTKPGDTLDDVLSMNVFFVRGFADGGTIGVSYGLPGPAGLHGTDGSGAVFTAEYMGGQTTDGLGVPVDGNLFTAQVLAHEVGHYLGLFHTSEQNGFNFDPLGDTPQCSRIAANCPDIDNLMFPFASATGNTITPNQAFVLGVNPLTKVGVAP